MRKLIEYMVTFYVKEGQFDCKGLIIGGCAQLKDNVIDDILFQKTFKKHLLKVITIAEIENQSIYQVVEQARDVLNTDNYENKLIENFNMMLNDPSQIDLLIFGTEQVIELFNKGVLKEIYLSIYFVSKDDIVSNPNKTICHIICNKEFIKMFGECVGVKYYVDNTE